MPSHTRHTAAMLTPNPGRLGEGPPIAAMITCSPLLVNRSDVWVVSQFDSAATPLRATALAPWATWPQVVSSEGLRNRGSSRILRSRVDAPRPPESVYRGHEHPLPDRWCPPSKPVARLRRNTSTSIAQPCRSWTPTLTRNLVAATHGALSMRSSIRAVSRASVADDGLYVSCAPAASWWHPIERDDGSHGQETGGDVSRRAARTGRQWLRITSDTRAWIARVRLRTVRRHGVAPPAAPPDTLLTVSQRTLRSPASTRLIELRTNSSTRIALP
jgi:hypothetical protein